MAEFRKTTKILTLPRLPIAQDNFASSMICAGNRRFAIYQVDTSAAPFWAVELFGEKPVREAFKYTLHTDAIACISNWARQAIGDDAARIPTPAARSDARSAA